MRTGRLPAQRLGIGTIINRDVAAGRRILYFGTATAGSNDESNLTLGDSTTYMSTIEAAFVTALSLGNGTGSLGGYVISDLTYGSVAFKMEGIGNSGTLVHKARLSVILIGTPDASYIVD